MNKIISKINSKNSHSVFIIGSIILLTVMSIVWGVSFASTVPADPTNLQQIDYPATQAGSSTNAIYLSWVNNAGSNLTQFILERKLSSESTYVPLPNQSIGPTIHSYTDQYNITAGVFYDYQIKACLISSTDALLNTSTPTGVTETLCSGYSEYKGAMVKTPNIAPITLSAPTGLTFNPDKLLLTTPVVELSWIDNSTNETVFNIKRISTANTATSVTFSKESTTTTSTGSTISISDPNEIVRGSSYYYQVQACAQVTATTTTQPCSSSVSVFISIPSSTPVTTTISSPTNLILKNTSTDTVPSVGLSWTDNSNNETVFKIVKIFNTNTVGIPLDDVVVLPEMTKSIGNTISISDNKVERNVNYYYKVQACSSLLSGSTTQTCSTFTPLVPITIPLLTPNTITIKAPTVLRLYSIPNSSSTSIQIIWTDNSNNETRFSVERKLSKESSYSEIPKYTNKDVNYYTDDDIIPGVSYDYRVKACVVSSMALSGTSVSLNCSESTELKGVAIPIPTITVKAPTGLILTDLSNSTSTSVKISWIDNSDNETKFIVERMANTDTSPTAIAYNVNLNETSYVDSDNLVRGINYYYRVKSCVTPTSTAALGGITQSVCSSPSETKAIMIPVITPKTNVTTDTSTISTNVENTISTPTITNTSIDNLDNKLAVENNNATVINKTSVQIQDISSVIDELKNNSNNTKEQLISLINDGVLNIINNSAAEGKKIDTIKINISRDELISQVENTLSNLAIITSSDVDKLKNDINTGIENIKILAGVSNNDSQLSTTNSENIANQLNSLSVTVNQNSEILKDKGGDLLFKDTNKDGISDYDSTFVYNIDPIKPSPVSIYEGKKINASEKILLGFDPSSTKLVKLNIEQPAQSNVSVIPSYKVKEVKLTEKNRYFLEDKLCLIAS